MIYILVIIIILGFVVNSITKKHILDKITCVREIDKKYIDQGESVNVSLTIENRKLIPITFLQFVEYIGESVVFNSNYMTIMPYQRVKRSYVKTFDKRGSYELYKAVLNGGDFIGFSIVDRNYKFDDEIVVFPKPAELDEDFCEIGELTGDTPVKKMIISDPLLTSGIREYTGFEPMNTIHWNSSLKTGELMVRNFEYTSDNSAFICLNLYTNFKPWLGIDEESIEKCYSTVRALIDAFEEGGIKYGFITNSIGISTLHEGEFVEPGIGFNHYNKILDLLGRGNNISYNKTNEFLENIISSRMDCRTMIFVTPHVYKDNLDCFDNLSNVFDKVILFSMKKDNVEYVNDNIIKYVMGSDR